MTAPAPQAARHIREQVPDTNVLLLSMHDDERYLLEALKAGASGYVLKSGADRDLVEACRAAMRGEPIGWGRPLAIWLAWAWIWALLTPPILRLTARYPFGRARALRSLLHRPDIIGSFYLFPALKQIGAEE